MELRSKTLFKENKAMPLDAATLKTIVGGKTESVTLRLVATVPPKLQAIHTANGIAIQTNIPAANINTREFENGAIVTVSAR